MKPQRRKDACLILLSVAALLPARALLLHSQASPRGEKATEPAKTQAVPKRPTASKGIRSPAPVPAHSERKEAALREISILPPSISLTGPRARQRLVIEGLFEDGHQEDLTAQVKVTSSDARVAVTDDRGFVQPTGDGETTLKVALQGHEASAKVQVKDFAAPFVWSFRNQVLPVMTKMGCNSGACHGAAAGKNGFKLTLRGYDPDLDYLTLTRQADARRTVKVDPAKSLILLKPTLTIPHGGGRRFAVGSPEFLVMAGWIAAGTPPPKDSDPRIESLEISPRHVSLRPGAQQQLLVTARFSDGHSEDVTRWTKFTSGDESAATVDQDGLVRMRGFGEAPVTVWYLSRVSFARLTVPYPYAPEESVFARAPRNNYLDDLVLKKLQELHIPPSRPATDEEFIRRAYLDAAGILPTAAETEKFLADRSPDKRARLIDELISRLDFVDYWAYKWSDLLLVSSEKLSPSETWSYYNWVRESVAKNKPWDQFAREIVTATGNTRENGAANYYAIQRDPIDVSENMTKAFLGMSITCAHCHNHPLEKWTQNDYFSMANLFARVRLKTGNFSRTRRALEDVTVFSSTTGDIIYPRLGRPLAPRPLEASALPLDSPVDRRVYFAQWLTSPQNPYFARALVNRVWKNFMGRGLVEAVDDMRATNPPTNEDLLNAVVKDFVGHGFDVRHLIRTLMNSATYQTSSEPSEHNVQDEKYYSHYILKRLPAEVLLDAVSQVTQVPEKFEGYPVGMRALQLPDTQVESYFLTVFGRPPRQQTSESERQSQPSITQALHIINGETLNNKLRAPGGTVDMLLKLGISNQRIVEYLYLSALNRYPSEAERRELVSALDEAQAKQGGSWGAGNPRRVALEDLTWAMLTSKEFMFNH
jgi:hypothetical protein